MLSNIIARRRWDFPDEIKGELINRLRKIVAKEYIDVMTNQGPKPMDGPADVTAVAAIRVLAMLEAQVQKDQHKLIDIELKKNEKPVGGDTYNIGMVGSIALGQEPLTCEDAKRQAQEVLARVNARLGRISPPAEHKTVIDVKPVVPIVGNDLLDL